MNESRSWEREEHVRQSKYINTEVMEKLRALEIPYLQDNERLRFACGSFKNTINHSRAITLLLENELDGSALGLLRPCFESFIAGLWLRYCANKDHIRKIGKGESRIPDFDRMLGVIVREGPGKGLTKPLSDALKLMADSAKGALNTHTHGGWEHIKGQLSAEGLEQNYPSVSIALTLMWADHCSLLSAAGVAAAAGNTCLEALFVYRSSAYLQLEVVRGAVEEFQA